MPRKSKGSITQFFQRDRVAFTALAKTGHVNLNHLKSCGLANSRINNLIRDRYIEKVSYSQLGIAMDCYRLTREGRDLCSKMWGIDRCYQAQNPIHDLVLANKYFSLSERVRESWKTENQVRDAFVRKAYDLQQQSQKLEADLYIKLLESKLVSMPDAVYVDEHGMEVAYEVITNSYKVKDLEAKETLVRIMNYHYDVEKI